MTRSKPYDVVAVLRGQPVEHEEVLAVESGGIRLEDDQVVRLVLKPLPVISDGVGWLRTRSTPPPCVW